MKKLILSIMAIFAAISVNAQTWNMVVTHDDGTTDTIATSKVKNVSFTLPDQNVESIIIKELYNGGCPKDEGTGYFQNDKGFIIYNNSPEVAVANNLCVGFASPYNADARTTWYTDGKLVYTDYIPAQMGIWYFQQPVILQPFQQIVVSCMGSIDNTKTYSQSVNYANKDYYAMYDPESGFRNTSYYPTPADVIPTSHYLKAYEYGQGNAWALSVRCPAFFLFQVKGTTPAAYAASEDNYVYEPGKTQNAISRCLKVPTSWIVDGMEIYDATKVKDSQKRLTSDIDNGYVTLTNKLGHSLYRNVDVDATTARPENAGKLVYNYTLAVDASQNGANIIDAEASIKNGAHIIYLDDNNSSTDFHERQQFSVRGK